MKRPEYNIYKALNRNFIIVYSVIALACFVSVGSLIFAYKTYKYNFNHMLTIDKDGEVLPLSMVKRADKIHIEIKNHIDMFLHYFYENDFNNWKESIEKALWLSDKSVNQLYLKKKQEGWYSQMEQFDIIEKINLSPDSIIVTSLQEPFVFNANFILTVRQNQAENKYKMRVSGNIISVNRNYPKNPHGLLIVRYIETAEKLQE